LPEGARGLKLVAGNAGGTLLGRLSSPLENAANKRSPRVVANVLEVNPERLWASLERSAEIGRFRDVGLRRLALSAEDKQIGNLSLSKSTETSHVNLKFAA
jgi:lambda repressor-like predicted transcriptional regulator